MQPFSVTAIPEQIRIYQLREPLSHPLPNVFCSMSLGGEHTVYKFTGKDDAYLESLSIQSDPRLYSLFSIHEDSLGLDHIGIVHFLSGLFSKEDIPILYVNTYGSNVVCVSEEYVDKAITIMKDHPLVLFDIPSPTNR